MRSLRVLALLRFGLIFAGTIAAGETGPGFADPGGTGLARRTPMEIRVFLKGKS